MDFQNQGPEIQPQPPQPSVEHEIAELERKLAEKRAQARVTAGEKAPPAQAQPVVATPQPTPPPITPAQIQQKPRAQQVQMLTQIALEQGIKQAVEIARKTNNAYLLDELHDALQDELYKALKGKP